MVDSLIMEAMLSLSLVEYPDSRPGDVGDIGPREVDDDLADITEPDLLLVL